MGFLRFILILALVLPPLPVMACGGAVPDTGTVAAHGGHHAPEHPPAAGEERSDHGCCDEAVAQGGCDAVQHCASGTPGGAVASMAPDDEPAWHAHHPLERSGADLPPSHSRPPYRPPAV